MKTILVLFSLLILLSGCASQNPYTHDKLKYSNYSIITYPMASYEEVTLAWNEVMQSDKIAAAPKANGDEIMGFSLWNADTNYCDIYYVFGDDTTLLHELKHCYFYKYHK